MLLVTIVQSKQKKYNNTEKNTETSMAQMWLIILQDEQRAVFCISFLADSIFTVT